MTDHRLQDTNDAAQVGMKKAPATGAGANRDCVYQTRRSEIQNLQIASILHFAL